MAYTRSDGTILINEHNYTNGSYRVKGWIFNSNSTGITEHVIKLPYDIEIINGIANFHNSEMGDYIDIVISPNTLIGITTTDQVSGNNVININPQSVKYMKSGIMIHINDIDYYVIKDTLNTTNVLLDKPLSSDVLAGTNIMFTKSLIENVFAVPGQTVEIGKNKIGSSYLPANTPFVIKYYSINNTSKEISFSLEYLY